MCIILVCAVLAEDAFAHPAELVMWVLPHPMLRSSGGTGYHHGSTMSARNQIEHARKHDELCSSSPGLTFLSGFRSEQECFPPPQGRGKDRRGETWRGGEEEKLNVLWESNTEERRKEETKRGQKRGEEENGRRREEKDMKRRNLERRWTHHHRAPSVFH